MQIEQIRIHQVSLPFSIEFSHSLRKRSSANNIVVEIVADQGELKGYGEGAPRSYVTGESQESAIKNLSRFLQRDSFPWELNDVSEIWNFVDGLPKGKAQNSAICALEISLLDALGKNQRRSVIDYFPKDFYNNTIHYGGAIPLAERHRVMEVCHLIKKRRINKLKLKWGRDLRKNREAIEAIKQIYGDVYDLKVDINGAWDYQIATRHVPIVREYNVRVVEQPMRPDDSDISHFAEVMRDCGVILMADESACSFADMERIAEEGYYGMVNVRLSKCGGFRNSLKIIDYLRDQGITFQIGCQLGESGLLSAAGRVLSLLCSDAVYYDGSYDEFLLKENVTLEHVTFGPGGRAGALAGPGLGVKISHQNLERLSDPSARVTLLKP